MPFVRLIMKSIGVKAYSGRRPCYTRFDSAENPIKTNGKLQVIYLLSPK